MTVKDVIKILQDKYKPTDEIVMAWWDRKEFDHLNIPDSEWPVACEIAEGIEWDRAHDQMSRDIEEYLIHFK
jgi:hypothetical protein